LYPQRERNGPRVSYRQKDRRRTRWPYHRGQHAGPGGDIHLNASAPTAGRKGGGMKGTVLVVDDERSIRVGLTGLLAKEGYEVTTAASGGEALQTLTRQPLDLMLTALRMPEMDGAGPRKKIKERSADPLVVMMTAYGKEKVAVEAMKAGAHDYLVKPFDNEEVKILVRQALEQAALRREVRQLRERLD